MKKHFDVFNEEYNFSNREKAKFPRGKSYWCLCDKTLVNSGQICPFCKRKMGKLRHKYKTNHHY